MPVMLSAIRELLMPAMWLMSQGRKQLRDFDLTPYPHLRAAVAAGVLQTVGDLSPLPKHFEVGDQIYETHMVFAGREYPQGWGRGPGGAAAEPPPEPDGKVDTYRMELNANMKELAAEIAAFIDKRGR
jgi:hypothetical protein